MYDISVDVPHGEWAEWIYVVLYEGGLEVVAQPVTYILGAPNIHSISRLLHAIHFN